VSGRGSVALASRPSLQVSADGESLAGQAGGVLLARAASVTGLRDALSAGLAVAGAAGGA